MLIALCVAPLGVVAAFLIPLKEFIDEKMKEREEEEKKEGTSTVERVMEVGELITNDPLHDTGRNQVNNNLMTEDSVVSTNQDLGGALAGGIPQTDMPTDDDLETFRIVFELFDRDRSGFIDNHDLAAISAKIGKDPQEGT